MSAISAFGSTPSWSQPSVQQRSGTHRHRSPEDAFASIDSTSQGFFDKAGLEAAVNSAMAAASQGAGGQGGKPPGFSSDDIQKAFNVLDTNGDGKVTKDEFMSTVSQLKGRHPHGHGPHVAGGANAAGGADAAGVDSDQDGDEAGSFQAALAATGSGSASLMGFSLPPMAAQALGNSGTAFSTADLFGAQPTKGSASQSDSAQKIQERLMRQIMQMVDAYSNAGAASSAGKTSSQVSVSA